jgi:soluble lytic murein transglycosylase
MSVVGRRAMAAVLALTVLLAAAPASRGQVVTSTPVELWLVPRLARAAADSLGPAVQDLNAGRISKALPVFTRAAADPAIGGYARLYQGRAQLALNQAREAAASAEKAAAGATGYLAQAALVLLADADQALGDNAGAVRALETLLTRRPLNPEPAYLRLGNAASLAGDRVLAAKSYRTVYTEYPLSEAAQNVASMLGKTSPALLAPSIDTLAADFSRAEQLFDARRFTDARKAFTAIRAITTEDDRDRAALRIAECDQIQKRTGAAIDALKDLLARPGPREPETRYYYLAALRDSGRIEEYVALSNAFVERNPGDPLAEAVLFDMSQYFTRADDDARAAAIAADAYHRFPAGAHADRMAWRAGWWAYKDGEYATTIALFSSAAVTFRHSDFRPSWVYWIAKASDRLNDRPGAVAAFRQTIADYSNTYYGRQARQQLAAWKMPVTVVDAAYRRPDPVAALAPGPMPANAALIRGLLGAGLYDDALNELRLVERDLGPTPLIEATMAYAWNRKGDLRSGIQTMRRAYPQFLEDGGETLPPDVLNVIFPVAYFDLIRKYADAHKLDPYVMAALIAQESTFDPGVKSAANAWGLMQILPSTGREYARKLGISPFRTARLTEPEVNVRIGMAFFADLLQNLGDLSLALAAYNAGEDRAEHWKAARQGVDQDEFIDDIPYTETQGYVRRILGQAEDYRRLYPIGKASAAGTSR